MIHAARAHAALLTPLLTTVAAIMTATFLIAASVYVALEDTEICDETAILVRSLQKPLAEGKHLPR